MKKKLFNKNLKLSKLQVKVLEDKEAPAWVTPSGTTWADFADDFTYFADPSISYWQRYTVQQTIVSMYNSDFPGGVDAANREPSGGSGTYSGDQGLYSGHGHYTGEGVYCGDNGTYSGHGVYTGEGNYSGSAGVYCGDNGSYSGDGVYSGEGQYSGANGNYSGDGAYSGDNGNYTGEGVYCGDNGTYTGAGNFGSGAYTGANGQYCCDNGVYSGNGVYCGPGNYTGDGVYCGADSAYGPGTGSITIDTRCTLADAGMDADMMSALGLTGADTIGSVVTYGYNA